MDGDAGRAVFLAYVGGAIADPRASEHAARLLANAVDQLEHALDLPTFHRGFTGCAWALAHVGAACGIDADTSDIDDALAEPSSRGPAWLEFEWLRGAAGFTIYALERMPATTPLLRALVDYFEAVAERIGAQVRWRMANPEEAVRFADGTFALGPAHGAAGALAALAGIAAAGVEVDRARSLIDGTLAWLASQRREGASAFTSYAGDTDSWPGWCSGDPGIAGTLDAAGRALARSGTSSTSHGRRATPWFGPSTPPSSAPASATVGPASPTSARVCITPRRMPTSPARHALRSPGCSPSTTMVTTRCSPVAPASDSRCCPRPPRPSRGGTARCTCRMPDPRLRIARGLLFTVGDGVVRVWQPRRREHTPIVPQILALLLQFGDGRTVADAADDAGLELDDAVAEAVDGLVKRELLVAVDAVAAPPPPRRLARERIDQIVDSASFELLADGPIITGFARIDDRKIAIAAWEPDADGGIESVLALQERVFAEPCPIVYVLDRPAVRARAAEVRQAASFRGSKTVQRLRQHQRQRILSRSRPTRQHYGMRKALAREHVAQAMDGFGVAVEIRKHWSSLSVQHSAFSHDNFRICG